MKRWRYGAGIIAETANNTYRASISVGHRKRLRKVLKSLADAKAWVLTNTGGAGETLTDEAQARALLPADITLVEAVRYWLQGHPQDSPLTISQLWQAYESKQAGSLRPRTRQAYKQSFARLRVLCDDCKITNLTLDRLERCFDGLTPVRRNGILRDMSAVFGWAKSERLIAINPADGLRKAKTSKAMPKAFSIEEVREVFALAEREFSAVIPALALGFFAGLRPNEISRLNSALIANGFIVIPPDVAKTSQARNVPIKPNLAKWLEAYPFASVPERALKAFRSKYTATGKVWHHDGARHSFATYAYELTKNASLVASEMGHTSTQIFFRHYRAMAQPNSGKSYFEIIPKIR